MHLQVLSSGSGGNSALVRAGEASVLIDAGLPGVEMEARISAAGLGPGRLDHVFVTHGHLDHARSAGLVARKHGATLHCAEALMRNASIRRHKRLSTLRIGSANAAPGPGGGQGLELTAVELPHDAQPTVAFRIDHGERRAVVLTDMGVPRADVGRHLGGAHVLVLEFNHDRELLENGPYPATLKRRIAGNGGHLSNEQAAAMLRHLASEQLHTLVLAHLSETNNRPELALASAQMVLDELGLSQVKVLIASQTEVGPNLEV